MIQWTKFILQCLASLGAPSKYVRWVQECTTSPRFSITLNGTLVGYFEGRGGIKSRGPDIPISFCDCNEILSRLMDDVTKNVKAFNFHPRCSKIKLTHLCFADDLLLLSRQILIQSRQLKRCFKSFLLCRGWQQIEIKVPFTAQECLSWWKSNWLSVYKWRKGSCQLDIQEFLWSQRSFLLLIVQCSWIRSQMDRFLAIKEALICGKIAAFIICCL